MWPALGKLVTQKVRKYVIELVGLLEVKVARVKMFPGSNASSLLTCRGLLVLAPGSSSLQWTAGVPGACKSRCIIESPCCESTYSGAGFYYYHSTWFIKISFIIMEGEEERK